MLAESELAGVEVIETMGELRFDGNPVPFRLGVEARRIDIAFAGKSELMIRASVDRCGVNVIEKFPVPAAKVRIFGKLAQADCANDSVEDPFISVLR